MARTVSFTTLAVAGLTLRYDDSGDIIGEWSYSIAAPSGERLARTATIAFTSGEQTTIKNFLAGKLNQLKASEGI